MIKQSTLRTVLSSLLLWTAACAMAVAVASPAGETAKPVHQLRIYQVHAGNEQPFHERFRDHALRIMARHGFQVMATWETKNGEQTEFVYLLRWPDEATMKERWAAFMADQEWIEIKRQTGKVHGVFVDGIQERTLRLTDYSPGSLQP